MTLKELVSDLALRHKSIGQGIEENHFALIGDESQVMADKELHYPCVLMLSEPEEFSGSAAALFRWQSLTLLFLDHVEDTGDFLAVQNTFNRMDKIACDFLRQLWADIIKTQFSIDDTQIVMQRIENVDSALYGKALSLRVSEPFCLRVSYSPFINY